MSTIHRLKILHWIPVVLDEDDGVSAGQIKSKTTDLCKKIGKDLDEKTLFRSFRAN